MQHTLRHPGNQPRAFAPLPELVNAQQTLLGVYPSAVRDAHHVFPKVRATEFWDRFGINVWSPSNGALWDSRAHRASAYRYNQEWSGWLSANATATATDAIAFAQGLARKYGFLW